MKCIVLLAALLVLAGAAEAKPRGAVSGTAFNGGAFQVNPNFTGIGGDYPFVNTLKNTSGGWALRDNSGSPSPADLDQYGYLLPNSDAILNHLGASLVVRIPAQAYVGGNCIPAQTGICYSTLVNGKGTYVNPGTPITATASSVTTGATTVINFAATQDFKAGMEVPISGTTGVTATNGGGGNITAGGTSGAWTVCAAGLTATSIQLCLNDQTTPLTTTGTAGGTTTVTYGRNAVGVAASGRIVSVITGSPQSINHGISSQDATTPITYRNGIDGLAIVLQGSEETRYLQWRAGTCPGGYNPACQFGTAYLAKLRDGNPGVIRTLNTINTNSSVEVNWADRRPAGYVSFGSYIYDRTTSGVSSVYVGTTTSAGNDYSATLGSGAPVDGQQITLSFDATAVTVANGANALITWTGHGLTTASPFYMVRTFSGSMPTGVTANTTYYAITSCGGCDANNIQFATSVANALAGTAVTTSSTGSGVLAHATVVATTATFTNGNSTIVWNDPLIQVGDQVSFTGLGTLAYPLNTGVNYFVKTASVAGSASNITISLTSGGAALTPLQSGTFGSVKNPTFNLNGTGAVAIKDSAAVGVGTVRNTYPQARSGGTLLYGQMTYDGVLGVWLKNGADISAGTSFFPSGWPPETALELCAAVGAHCWFQPPRFTIDGVAGITDYNPGLYAMVKANAPSWMIPRFEIIPNEFWNNLFQGTIIQTAHAAMYVATAGWTPNSGIHQIAGKIGSVLGQAVNNAYGNPAIDGTKYQTVVGVQTFNFSTASGATTNAPRLTSADYVAQSTSPQSPYTKSAAYNWATHVACAQYFSPGYTGNFVATSLAAANAGGVITGSISGNQLTVTSVRVATSPVFGAGSTLIQGPGIIPGTVVSSGASSPYTLDRTYTNAVGSTDISYVASGYDATAAQTYVDSLNTTASFTGSISGTTLTATGVTGFITLGSGSGGDLILGSGVTATTKVNSQSTGTQGKDGTYVLSISQTVGSTAMTSVGQFSLPAESLMYQAVYAFAQTYTNSAGLKLKMNGYEGGYSPDFVSAGLSLTDQLYADGKLVTSSSGSTTGVKGYVATNLQNFKAAGGEFPSLFQFTGISPASNVWSALDDLYQPAPTPIWDAYKEYNFLLKRDLDPASNDNDPMWLEKAA